VFLILKHNYLLLILGVSCLYEISLTCLDYEMKLIGLDRFRAPPDFLEDSSIIDPRMNEEEVSAFTTFMGRYGQLTNVLSLLLSYYAFPYLMENFGLKHTLRIFPTLLLAIATMTFIALPMNLPVLFISMSLLKALTYSINDPAKEILYIPTSNTVKFKAKFWIDVVGARVAKAIGSSINTYAGTAERIVQYGSLPSVVTALALWVICYAAGIKFDSLLETGEIVGNDEDKIQKDILIDGNDSNYQDYSFEGSDDDDIGNDSQSDWRSDASIELQSLN
jgi:AAA family ATP:ADP antiporter